MNDGLKQLQSNRIRMRANEFAFYYTTMKELAKELVKGDKLNVSKRIVITYDQSISARGRRCQRLVCGVFLSRPVRSSDGGSVTRFATFYINISPDFIR